MHATAIRFKNIRTPFHEYCTTHSSLVWRVAYFYQLYLVFVLRSLTYVWKFGDLFHHIRIHTGHMYPISHKTTHWTKKAYLHKALCMHFRLFSFWCVFEHFLVLVITRKLLNSDSATSVHFILNYICYSKTENNINSGAHTGYSPYWGSRIKSNLYKCNLITAHVRSWHVGVFGVTSKLRL